MRSSETIHSLQPGFAERQALRVWFQKTEGAIMYGEFGDFKVHRTYRDKNIPKAKVRINVDVLLQDDFMLGLAAGELVREIGELRVPFDAIAGVPSGGTRLAEKAHTLMRKFSPVDIISVKKDSDHFELLEQPRPGSRVILIEDVMTTGESLKELIRLLQSAQCEVVAVVTLVDRKQYAEERLAKICPVRSVLTLEQIVPNERREEVMEREKEMKVKLTEVFKEELSL